MDESYWNKEYAELQDDNDKAWDAYIKLQQCLKLVQAKLEEALEIPQPTKVKSAIIVEITRIEKVLNDG